MISSTMKTSSLHIGMRVRHPSYGPGTVQAISPLSTDIKFDDQTVRTVSPETSELQPAETHASITALELPLHQFVEDVVRRTIAELGIEGPDPRPEELAPRWHRGRMVLHPADPTLQIKEIEIEVFFHKIVGMRNQLRVLEQKINAHSVLTDAEKIDLQQYISRCYGSMTTFNLLFKDKESQFRS